jgi:hypothetical protein
MCIDRLLAQEFGEHQVGRGALGQAVAVSPVGAGDVVVRAQRFADADGNGFLADVQVSQPGHQRASVEIVDPFLEQPDRHHLVVEADQLVVADG